jgi:bifunctional DNase/RNase
VFPNLAQLDATRLGLSCEECALHALLFGYEPQRYNVVLKGNNSESVFVFETGYVQACSLYGAIMIKRTPSDTPLTYDLFGRIIEAMGGRVLSAIVDSYDTKSETCNYYLVIESPSGSVKIKCRGSDAVGIAHFGGVPIKIDAALLGRESAR